MNATAIRKIQELNNALEAVQKHGSMTHNIMGRITGERIGPMSKALVEDMAKALIAAQEALVCIMEEAPVEPTDWEAKYLKLHKEKKELQVRFERLEANSVAWQEMAEHHKAVIQEKNQALWDIVLMVRQEAREPQHTSAEACFNAIKNKAEQACGKTFEQAAKEALLATFVQGK